MECWRGRSDTTTSEMLNHQAVMGLSFQMPRGNGLCCELAQGQQDGLSSSPSDTFMLIISLLLGLRERIGSSSSTYVSTNNPSLIFESFINCKLYNIKSRLILSVPHDSLYYVDPLGD